MPPFTKAIVAILIASGLFVIAYGAGHTRSIPVLDALFYSPRATPAVFKGVVREPSNIKPTPTATPDGRYKVQEHAMNTAFTIEGVEYSVESAADLGNDLSKQSDGGMLAMGQSNGGKFIVVKFTAKNTRTSAASLQHIAAFLSDSAGRNYSPVGFADRVMFQPEGYDEFENSSFNPTVVKPGIVTKLFILSRS